MEEWPEKKPLLSDKNRKARFQFAKRHVGDSPNVWRKVLWSDETKIELFSHQGKCYVWGKPNTSHHLKNMLFWGCFSAAGSGKLVRDDGKMDGAKYRDIFFFFLFIPTTTTPLRRTTLFLIRHRYTKRRFKQL